MRITLAQPARSVGLLFAGLAAGGVLMAGGMAAAADDTGPPDPSTSTSAPGAADGAPEGRRAGETALTGDTAQSVKDAVLAKYPDATIDGVETDNDGVYEAHITKADGSRATVELDEDFAITGEEAGGERGGHGRGGPGGHGRGGHGGHGGAGECDRDDATAPATTGEATTAS